MVCIASIIMYRIAGGRQILSVCQKGTPQDHLHHLAKKCKKSLEVGMTLNEVKLLLHAKLGRGSIIIITIYHLSCEIYHLSSII